MSTPIVNTGRESRPERAQEHLVFLDQCRGVAILLVFLNHCTADFTGVPEFWKLFPLRYITQVVNGGFSSPALPEFLGLSPFRIGWPAVAIFFVVSGFCIHLSSCRASTPSLTAFYIRRFFRIYPAYLVALLFFATAFPGSSLPFTKLSHWAILISHLFHFHNFFEISISAINPVYWTIAIEVQIYLLYPVFIRFARRFSFARLLLVLGMIELSLHTFSIAYFYTTGRFAPIWLRASPFFYCFSWTLGAALANDYLTGKTAAIAKVSPFIWLVLALLSSMVCSVAHEFSFTFFALATAGVIARHLNRDSTCERNSAIGRFIERAGVYSYSIYLIHYPIMVALMGLYESWFPEIKRQVFLSFGIAITTSLVVLPFSVLMYYSLEKPGIALGKRIVRAWSMRQARQLAFAPTQPLEAK